MVYPLPGRVVNASPEQLRLAAREERRCLATGGGRLANETCEL